MKELLLGCGNNWKKKIVPTGSNPEFQNLVTLDIDEDCGAHVIFDLNQLPWPFEDHTFDEVHAYEVLEHLGTQGDWKAFFDHFGEIHRILKPGGVLCASVPRHDHLWAWGDPGHTRIINEGTLSFLSQKIYEEGVGTSPMTDYRGYWKRDFEFVGASKDDVSLYFVLKAK